MIQCILGTVIYPDSGITIISDAYEYSQSYGQIEEVFRALIENDSLQPYISFADFSSFNDGIDVGYNL